VILFFCFLSPPLLLGGGRKGIDEKVCGVHPLHKSAQIMFSDLSVKVPEQYAWMERGEARPAVAVILMMGRQ
jgi:hypothetical protein